MDDVCCTSMTMLFRMMFVQKGFPVCLVLYFSFLFCSFSVAKHTARLEPAHIEAGVWVWKRLLASLFKAKRTSFKHRWNWYVVRMYASYVTPPELVLYTYYCHVDHSLSRMWQTKYESLFRFSSELNSAWFNSCTSACYIRMKSIETPNFTNLTYGFSPDDKSSTDMHYCIISCSFGLPAVVITLTILCLSAEVQSYFNTGTDMEEGLFSGYK